MRDSSEGISHEAEPLFTPVEFSHQDRSGNSHVFHIEAHAVPSLSQPKKGRYFFLSVMSEENTKEAETTGIAVQSDGKNIFFELNSANFGTKKNDAGQVIEKSEFPGLMREAVAQLLLSQSIDTWYSDAYRSPGSEKMYVDLLRKYESEIAQLPDEDMDRYILKLKSPIPNTE